MKQKEIENNRNLIIILVISIIILISIVAVGTYSFYTTSLNTPNGNKEETKMSTTTIEFGLEDGTVTGDNLIPGDVITKTFQVKNTGSKDVTFKLMWKSVVNNFVNKQDLLVTLEEDGTEIISPSDNQIVPNTTNASTVIKDNLKINSGETKSYILVITYQDTTENQIDDMGKSISGVLELGT